ncbi:hypothetical protein [Azospirillum argentinense]
MPSSVMTVQGFLGALQPGICLLPVITDRECEALTIRRDHTLVIPASGHLPFVPRGLVF